MKRILKNKWIKMIIISFLVFSLVLINYIYIRPYYIDYDALLRCFDHIISGIGTTWILTLMINDYKFASFIYVIASFFWEIYQFIQRNFEYYQYGQSFSDILGVLMFILIIKFSNNKIYTGYGLGKTRKLDTKKYMDLYNYIWKVSNEMGVTVKNVYVENDEFMGGSTGLNNIYISSKSLDRYFEDPHIAKLTISHELAHIKNKDTSFKGSLENLICGFIDTKKSVIKMLLRETRADIEGAAFSGLSKEEITDAHKKIEEHNKKISSCREYKFGYPSRDKRIKYSTKYIEFNKAAEDEIIKDYYNTKNIKCDDIKIKV